MEQRILHADGLGIGLQFIAHCRESCFFLGHDYCTVGLHMNRTFELDFFEGYSKLFSKLLGQFLKFRLLVQRLQVGISLLWDDEVQFGFRLKGGALDRIAACFPNMTFSDDQRLPPESACRMGKCCGRGNIVALVELCLSA